MGCPLLLEASERANERAVRQAQVERSRSGKNSGRWTFWLVYGIGSPINTFVPPMSLFLTRCELFLELFSYVDSINTLHAKWKFMNSAEIRMTRTAENAARDPAGWWGKTRRRRSRRGGGRPVRRNRRTLRAYRSFFLPFFLSFAIKLPMSIAGKYKRLTRSDNDFTCKYFVARNRIFEENVSN